MKKNKKKCSLKVQHSKIFFLYSDITTIIVALHQKHHGRNRFLIWITESRSFHPAFIQPWERSPSANPSASAPPASKRCETCTIVSFQGRSDRHFLVHEVVIVDQVDIGFAFENTSINVWVTGYELQIQFDILSRLSRLMFVNVGPLLLSTQIQWSESLAETGIFFSRKPAVSALDAPAKPPGSGASWLTLSGSGTLHIGVMRTI